MDLFKQLTSRDSLLAIGVMLIVASVILRGFARDAQRSLARRKQHKLDDRKTADADLNRELDRAPGWMERNISQIASTALITGVLIALVSFFIK